MCERDRAIVFFTIGRDEEKIARVPCLRSDFPGAVRFLKTSECRIRRMTITGKRFFSKFTKKFPMVDCQ